MASGLLKITIFAASIVILSEIEETPPEEIIDHSSHVTPIKDSSLRLELLDDAWCSSDNESQYPIPYVSPNRKVLIGRSLHSTPANSMDLEWEHLPEMVLQRKATVGVSEKVEEVASGTSISAWSRQSSRDSLEWDPSVPQLKQEEEYETDILLQEIERLNSKTLRETFEWDS